MIDNLIKKLIQKIKSKYSLYRYQRWYNKVSKFYLDNPEAYKDFLKYLRADKEFETNLFFQFFVHWGENYFKYKDNPELLIQKQKELTLKIEEKLK